MAIALYMVGARPVREGTGRIARSDALHASPPQLTMRHPCKCSVGPCATLHGQGHALGRMQRTGATQLLPGVHLPALLFSFTTFVLSPADTLHIFRAASQPCAPHALRMLPAMHTLLRLSRWACCGPCVDLREFALPNVSTDRRFELMPLEELGGRPRIDVLCNMSGIFRDSFQNVVELLDDLFQRAAEADESEDLNFIRQALTAFPCMALVESLAPGHLIDIACTRKCV